MKEAITPVIQIEELDRELAKAGSVSGLLTRLMELESVKSYLELSSDEEIKSYFQQKGISNVRNQEELKSFYNQLENRIGELATSPDERVKSYFEKVPHSRKYLENLLEIPTRLSRLEQTSKIGFDELKPKFKEVLNYIWEAVMEKGFSMEEKGKDALKKYKGGVEIYKSWEEFGIENRKRDVVIINAGNYKKGIDGLYQNHSLFNLTILKEKIERKKITEIKKGLFGKEKEKIYIKNSIVNPEKGNFFTKGFILGHIMYTDSEYTYCSSVEELIECLKKEVQNKPEECLPQLPLFINTFLNLPNIMENYLKKNQKKLEEVFKK